MRDIPTHRKILLCGLSLVLVVGAGGTPVVAQEATAPSVTLSDATITAEVGETSTVDATYRFQVTETGSGEEALTAISGTMWRFSGNEISDLAVAVDGESVTPEVTENERFLTVAVPVEGVASGDTVSVSVSYTVAGTADRFKAPIWVPEFQTTGDGRVVEMTTSLPDGTQVQGAAFPKVDSADGSTLSYTMLHVPGFVQTDYGEGSGGLLTVDTLSTVVGLTLILGILGSWLVWTRRQQAGGRNVV